LQLGHCFGLNASETDNTCAVESWYDHVMPPIVSKSSDTKNDRLLGVRGLCGTTPAGVTQDHCGYGPRVPKLVISPYSKTNFVDHSLTDQSSILRFIEDNWGLGRMGNQTFDVKAGPINNMFDFSSSGHRAHIVLSPTTGMQNATGLTSAGGAYMTRSNMTTGNKTGAGMGAAKNMSAAGKAMVVGKAKNKTGK
jgi:phospholipase C